jgi:3-oxoadipate enol-lactonase/4-carboxymuconolactone decarboxylase
VVSVPRLSGVQLSEPSAGPLLVLGPSLGTSTTTLWWRAAELLADRFHVVGWDLPGHVPGAEVGGAFTLPELAAGVLALVEEVLAERGEPGGQLAYAGDSVGGAVGLQLLLDHPERIRAAVLLCTGAKIGDADGWRERAGSVRASGTPVMVPAAAQRWFASGFLDRQPAVATGLLHVLQHTDAEGYAQVCEALAGFDVRGRLTEITVPVLAVAGAQDVATPPELVADLAAGVANGRLVVLDEVAHLAPVEAPDLVARLIIDHLVPVEPAPAAPPDPDAATQREVYDAGMAVRRDVLGGAHVDRATAAVTDLTRDFQEMITRYAWGTIWTRPGLDRRTRSMITITALVARGHHEELALHLRAALTNGVTRAEISEVLLQSAIYCGVPDANTAFRIAQQVFADLDDPDVG